MINCELLQRLKSCYDLICNGDYDGYRKLHKELAAPVQAASDPKLLGEWLLLAMPIHIYGSDGEACANLIRGKELLQEASAVFGNGPCGILNFGNPLCSFHRRPGQLEEEFLEVEGAMAICEELTGNGQGISLLFRGEAAYKRGDLAAAEELGLQALKAAESAHQQITAADGATLLGNVAKYRGDYSGWQKACSALDRAEQGENNIVKQYVAMRRLDLALCIWDIDNEAVIPPWFRDGSFAILRSEEPSFMNIHIETVGESPVNLMLFPTYLLEYALYLIYCGSPARALNVVDMAETTYKTNSLLLLQAYYPLIRAAACNALGDKERTRLYAKQALDICAPDGLWLFCLEFDGLLGGVIAEMVEKMDEKMLLKLNPLVQGLSENIRKLNEKSHKSRLPYALTWREYEIARLGALRLSNKDIARKLHISERTVNAHLSAIYAKLGINSRKQLSVKLKAEK